jgi:hypothetical protein
VIRQETIISSNKACSFIAINYFEFFTNAFRRKEERGGGIRGSIFRPLRVSGSQGLCETNKIRGTSG